MMFTVDNFIFYCAERYVCEVVLFDLTKSEICFHGTMNQIPDKYRSYIVGSFDAPIAGKYDELFGDENTAALVLNITTIN